MITSHQNKTHVYYRKDGNKIGARKFRRLMQDVNDMMFTNYIYRAIHTPLMYVKTDKGY